MVIQAGCEAQQERKALYCCINLLGGYKLPGQWGTRTDVGSLSSYRVVKGGCAKAAIASPVPLASCAASGPVLFPQMGSEVLGEQPLILP